MSSGQVNYRVVFWGDVTPGQQRNDVARRFARRFGIRDHKLLARLFSGCVITLKKGLGHQEARCYCELIRQLGALCRMEPEFSILGDTTPVRRSISRDREAITSLEGAGLAPLGDGEAPGDDHCDNPFAARDVATPKHPPFRYSDPWTTRALQKSSGGTG